MTNYKRHGFTLLELLVVIAIIGVLAAVSIPRFSDFRAAAYDARSQQDLRNLASAQELHRATHESYATDPSLLSSFRGSAGVTITIESANEIAFRASARHLGGLRRYTWDSEASPPLSSVVVR